MQFKTGRFTIKKCCNAKSNWVFFNTQSRHLGVPSGLTIDQWAQPGRAARIPHQLVLPLEKNFRGIRGYLFHFFPTKFDV